MRKTNVRSLPSLRAVSACIAALLAAPFAGAHPGHGEPGASHYVTDPAHVIPLMIIGTVLVFLAFGWHKTQSAGSKAKA